MDLERQVGEQLAQPVLAGRLGLDQARRQGVGGDPFARHLDEPELGDVPADRGLGRAEPTLAQRGRELLLGPEWTRLDEIADRPLAELLHDFHVAPPLPREPDDDDQDGEADPIHHEDVEGASLDVVQQERGSRSGRTRTTRSGRR